MNKHFKTQLQQHVAASLLQGDGYTQSELARKRGVDKAYVSQIKGGKWTDNIPSASQWHKLAAFFGKAQHIESENFRMIQHACERAHADKGRIGIDGYTGAGKSYALAHYAQQPGVFLITCNPAMSKMDFLRAIATKVGAETKGNAYKVLMAIVNRLKSLDNPFLIFDECEYIRPLHWHLIKALIQDLKGVCGVAVCGIIKDVLAKMAGRDKAGFPQLVRRIGHSWVNMRPIPRKEIKRFATDNSIQDLRVVDMLYKQATDYDTLTTQVRELVGTSERFSRAITPELYADLFYEAA